ncbi:MAG TPA: HAD family phosphatase, partial [Phycisphaerae bacterium]|nr:HAD family phosphatase [Phycisphaerae bacterium]
MDALIFDFDGVVVDSEPVHCATFQQVLRTRGVEMSRDDYYSRYLGFDDHDCFLHAGADAGRRFSEDEIARMTAEKTVLVQRAFGESIQPLRGAVELIASAAGRGVPVGVCSGALKGEIELASRTVGALDHFTTIVSAEEVPA